MYSLETTSEREFVCPFKTVATTDTVDFGQFRSYKFAATDENTELEANINRVIEKELAKKGFTSDEQNPDLLIQTFYYFDKNPNYVGPNPIKLKQPVYRFHTLILLFPDWSDKSRDSFQQRIRLAEDIQQTLHPCFLK